LLDLFIEKHSVENHPSEALEKEKGHMYKRINYDKVAPDGVKALYALGTYLANCGLEHSLKMLVRLRASQIKGCVLCVDMHTKELEELGMNERKIHSVSVWQEAPFFDERERAALAWTEAVTLISEGRVPDEVYQQVRKRFDEKELVDLTMVLANINAWNRIAISFRHVPDL
jgi:AhpD family alkylhydroperoxidase